MVYVRNLSPSINEDTLKEKFSEFGKIERVKKLKDYGFVHFEDRGDAIKAIEQMDGLELDSLTIEVSLAKPATENKKKEQRKRDQERRMRGGYYGYEEYWAPPPMRGMMSMRGSSMRRPPYAGEMIMIDTLFYITVVSC